MPNIATPNTFGPNTLIKSADVNANFSEIQTKYNAGAVQTDVAKTITVSHLWNALQTFAVGVAVSAGNVVISSGSTTGGQVALQANGVRYGIIGNGVGLLGDGTQDLVLTADAGNGIKLVPNSTGSAKVVISPTGLVTLANGLTMLGAITLSTAASKIVAGATSLSLRNNADNADNLLVADVGDVTVRRDATIIRNATVTGNLTVAGIVAGGVVAVAQTSDLTNTTTTPANTSLAVTLGASQTWKIDFDLMVSCNNVGGIVLNFAGPAGVTGAQMLVGPTSAATTFTTFTFGSFAASSTWSTYNSAANAVYIRGSCYVVTAGTGGAFTLQYAAGTAAQTAKVVAGSTLHATRIS